MFTRYRGSWVPPLQRSGKFLGSDELVMDESVDTEAPRGAGRPTCRVFSLSSTSSSIVAVSNIHPLSNAMLRSLAMPSLNFTFGIGTYFTFTFNLQFGKSSPIQAVSSPNDDAAVLSPSINAVDVNLIDIHRIRQPMTKNIRPFHRVPPPETNTEKPRSCQQITIAISRNQYQLLNHPRTTPRVTIPTAVQSASSPTTSVHQPQQDMLSPSALFQKRPDLEIAPSRLCFLDT